MKYRNLGYFSHFKALAIFGLLSLIGLSIIPSLNIKLNPQKINNYIYIKFNYPKGNPKLIENEITSRLEGITASIEGTLEIDSKSKKGEGQIKLKIDPNIDLKKYKLHLNNAIRQSWKHFPEEMSYPIIDSHDASDENQITLMSYSITSNADISFLHNWVNNELSPELLKIKGTEEIIIDGIFNNEIHFIVDQNIIDVMGITIDEIRQAIRNYKESIDISPLVINSPQRSSNFILRLFAHSDNTLHPEKIPVKKFNNKIVMLSDITQSSAINAEINTKYRVNGINSIFVRIIANEDANNLVVASRIHHYFNSISNKTPDNIKIKPAFDSTQFIKDELLKIGLRTILSLFLIFITIWLIYKDRNYIFIIIISFLVNISIASIFYYILNIEIHFFAMAGITLSFGIMIDNSIVVIDYMKKRSNKKIILPLFAATLTTIISLWMINIVPFQKEDFWIDFTMVIIINLALSLFSSLFLLPALIYKLPLKKDLSQNFFSKQKIINFNTLYSKYISVASRYKKVILCIFIFAFGTPFFLLPEKIHEQGILSHQYNMVFNNPFFKEKIRPWINVILGGTIKPFYLSTLNDYEPKLPEPNNLRVYAESQKEYTFEQLDNLIVNFEKHLLKQQKIEQIKTQISPNKTASLTITFKENEQKLYPYKLFDEILDYLQKFGGGADWNIIYKEQQASIQFEISRNKVWHFYLYGYDYEKLMKIAYETKNKMTKNPRARNISIDPEYNIFAKNTGENDNMFFFYDKTQTNIEAQTIKSIYNQVQNPIFLNTNNYSGIPVEYYLDFKNNNNSYYNFFHLTKNNRNSKLLYMGNVKNYDNPQMILRHNQQYQLSISYDFLSSARVAKDYENKQIALLNRSLPPGFFAASSNWDHNENNLGWILIIVIIIISIFFITSILFESLYQSFWVILMIPFSYIGVFLTFCIFNINFDQGGYASFIILGGTTVNASIYILNTMNNTQSNSKLKSYIKAWNMMFIPIILTTISTILGFIPFLIGDTNEVFWRALASGTIGGLIFSIPVLFLLLPLGMVKKNPKS